MASNISLTGRALLKVYHSLKGVSIKRNIFNANNCRLILVSAFPRAASNNITGKILELMNDRLCYLDDVCVCDGAGHNFMDEWKLRAGLPLKADTMIYGHIPANHCNYEILRGFRNVYVLVPIRSLPDVVVSYHDFIKKSGRGPIDWRCSNSGPECCSDYFSLSLQGQLDYIVDFIAPWYVRFVSAWLSVSKEFRPLFISFESQTNRTSAVLNTVIEKTGLVVTEKDIERVNRSVKTYNMNVGISGRGKELSRYQLDRLEKLVSYHENIKSSGLDKYLLGADADDVLKNDQGIQFV